MNLWDPHRDRLKRLELVEDDFIESFSRSAGPGGQHVNKVSTAVELRHGPTGLSVSVQESRSQLRNRETARQRLLDLIEKEREERKRKRRAERERLRRRNRPRPPALKRKILEGKRRRSDVKRLRRKPDQS